MKNLSTWLLVMFMVMFWAFRVIVTLMSELGMDFAGLVPLNRNFEIALLFITLLCVVLIVKRNIIGALIYLLAYGMYFGVNLFENVSLLLMQETTDITGTISTSMNTLSSFIGIVIPIAVLLDLLFDKSRKNNPKDKKTDWFYNNKDFDRELDDRADKNNYRTM